MTRIRGFEFVSRVKGDSNYKLPVRGSHNAAAYDFFSPISLTIKPGAKGIIKTGIKSYFQDDEGLFIITRGGNGTKRRVTLANTTALIDADYYDNSENEGEISIVLVNGGTDDFVIEIGHRIAQGWFQKILLVDNDSSLGLRKSGFGSSGK